MLPASVRARQCAKEVQEVHQVERAESSCCSSWSSRSGLHVVGRPWLCGCHDGQHGHGQQGFSVCARCCHNAGTTATSRTAGACTPAISAAAAAITTTAISTAVRGFASGAACTTNAINTTAATTAVRVNGFDSGAACTADADACAAASNGGTPSCRGVPCRIAPSDCLFGQSAWPTAAYSNRRWVASAA